ncbi:MAG: hypothetical protein ACYC2H_13445 [Thermoplasmatota archaeon]
MHVREDLLDMEWEGPLAAVGDLPALVLYGAVLSFAFAAPSLAALREALEPLFGNAEERRSLLRRTLSWGGVGAEANLSGGRAVLRFGTRLKGNRLEDVVRRLGDLPEARDLRLRGSVRRFGQAPDSAPLDG